MKRARFAISGQILEGWLEDGQLVVPYSGAYNPDDVTWLPPVAHTTKAIGLALNYAAHADELGLDRPTAPVLFNKNITTFIGHKGKIIAPKNVDYMHYENELVVVIGQPCRKVKAEHADQVIQGYTIGNDITIRDFVTNFYRPPVKAKGFDTFGPIGPYLVTADEILDTTNLQLNTYVNGELRQQGNTKDLIYTIPELIEYITDFMTLEAGDMIWTGTPPGISHIFPGDIMRLEIERIGVLENEVVEEA